MKLTIPDLDVRTENKIKQIRKKNLVPIHYAKKYHF